jgi:hypothetical protein
MATLPRQQLAINSINNSNLPLPPPPFLPPPPPPPPPPSRPFAAASLSWHNSYHEDKILNVTLVAPEDKINNSSSRRRRRRC